MITYIESILQHFRICFSREASFKWFVILIFGLMVRSDHLGVTAVIRELVLDPGWYVPFLNFFRSSAFTLSDIRKEWYRVVKAAAPLTRVCHRAIMVGDGLKSSKEGLRMPGVKKMKQESETSSKPQYIHGHFFGALGVVVSNMGKRFCLPLKINLQDGVREPASWQLKKGIVELTPKNHIEQIVESAFEAAEFIGNSFLLLDGYFLSQTLLKVLDRLNQKRRRARDSEDQLVIITRAKKNCRGFLNPRKKLKGRPSKKGKEVHLAELFQYKKRFTKATAWMYGQNETISYYCINLLWGPGLYRKLRFVLVEWKGNRLIFVSTDLTIKPVTVIELYARRFSCEELFRELKQEMGAFCYRFWTKSHPKLSHFRKKDLPDILSSITDPREQRNILKTIKAIETFVACAAIAMGTLQMLALNADLSKDVLKCRYLRQYSSRTPSEASVMYYLRRNLFSFLLKKPDSFITRYILEKQEPASKLKNHSSAA